MRGILSFGVSAFIALALTSCESRDPAPRADLVVLGATLIDATGSAARPATDVFMNGGVITAVLDAGVAEVPPGATVIDAAGSFAIPGLSDMHVHFSLGLPGPRQPGETEEVLRRLLYYGVTSVLNLGASAGTTDSIRAIWAAQEAGAIQGPTIYGTGGHVNVPGGHPVWTIFPPAIREQATNVLAATPDELPADLYDLGLGISFVRTPEAARAAVRERAAGGMHAIKITVESGPSEYGEDHPLMPVELIRTIVDEAERHGLPVLAHVSSPNELDSVMAGGAHGVVHAVTEPPYPSVAAGDEIAARQLYTVPTLSLFDAFIRYLEDPLRVDDPFLRETVTSEEVALLAARGLLEAGSDRDSLPRWRQETDAAIQDVGELHRLGAPVVLGTDVGNPMVFPGFTAHQELLHLVEAGLSPMEAIQAASLNAARLLGRADEFGTIEVGKRADMVILGSDPLADIRNSRTIEAVIARGRLIDRGALLSGRREVAGEPELPR